ncbi:MAG: YtxH domain-containing protein [Syntrophales bacterium]|jgi:gas vesicle protein
MSERCSDFVKGLILGGILGAVAGVLYAPKSGKETREDIGKKANEWLIRAKEEYDKATEKSKKIYDATVKKIKDFDISAKESMDKIAGRAEDIVGQGIETAQDSKGRFKKAIEAGVEAYKQEKEA